MTGEGASASRTLQALQLLGSYELVRPLAQGGMADIYLGRCADDRHVAVKVLNRERSKEPEACTMFLQEARVVALLDHPNIARIYDVEVTPDGHHYLAMEYVHGSDLRELLSAASQHSRALPYDTAIAIVIGAAAGLDHAHRRCTADGKPLRLVHRDVSLSNIMVSHAGEVKVVDFGIASTAIQTVHTSPGIVRGKASYMSPEQCMGDRVDHRTDVFALGVVLYELTTGARCFAGKSDFERMLAVVRGEYHAPHDIIRDFPPELEQVIACALSIDAGLRYPSAAALIEALERVAGGRGWATDAQPIVREMKLLFGDVPAPLAMTAADPMRTEQHLAVMPIIPPMPAPKSRLARGTESDPVAHTSLAHQLAPLDNGVRGSTPSIEPAKLQAQAIRTFTGWAPAPRVIDDDQPTRGRYVMRRPPTAPGDRT
jgi:serine/threonine protein kinase